MKRFLYLLLIISSVANAQPISQMPTFIGNPGAGWIPVVISNTNRKIAADGMFDAFFSSKSTSNLPEGSNQYFSQARARAALSAGSGILYDAATGITSANLTFLDNRYTTNLTFGPTFTYNSGVVNVDLTKLSRLKKVVPDADYTVTANDECIVLPDPSTTRTCNLPAASTMPGLSITIVCAATSLGEWILNGSFVQTASTGTSPFIENFTNSTLAPGQRINLHSINDNGTYRWFDLY